MKHTFGRVIISKADLIFLTVVLLTSGAFYLFLTLGSAEGSWVVVSRNGEEIARYSLHENTELRLQDENGEENELIIEQGKAWIERANCPDGLCIRQGRIHRAGESIICLPHRLVLSIEGGDSSSGPDAMVK